LASHRAPAYVRRVAFSPDGKHLAIGYGELGMVRVVDSAADRELFSFRGNLRPLFTLTYAHGGKRLLTSGVDGTAALWEPEGGKVRRVATFYGHPGQVTTAVLSADERTLATSASDRTIRLWDVSSLLPKAAGKE